MAYNDDNPPSLASDTIGGAGGSIWIYKSTDDGATVNGAGYVQNAAVLGMDVGDLVVVIDTATPKTSLHYVDDVDVAGAATLAFAAVM